ncbi:MAG: ABC transporter ATP-binding protein, partial [Bosea sp. (in: a-proteobacteria)]
MIVLAMIVLSLPFYFAAFDLPKRIINDALMGRSFSGSNTSTTFLNLSFTLPEMLGGTYNLFSGFQVNQLQLLFSLSTVFLLLVIINGAFKYYINLSKGILGERMLRRMRFEVFALYLRFKPEDIRSVKPAEAASIIKDEIDPIGGFTGDAFIQPAFLCMQAFTAMLFIMVQSFWLGLVALSVVMVQGFIIPRLRREQLRLSRLRQIESRRLAGRIGEVIEIAPAIHTTGSASYVKADLGNRLGVLFEIRTDLFRRKFAVKYLNNFLAQVTPFFFYSIGGYLALTGAMNIGQLVAVIAAYRDLPPPIKELIDWDQERADVTVKYQQIVAQFPSRLLSTDDEDPKRSPPPPDAPLQINNLQVSDRRGGTILAPMTLTIARPSHVALLGAVGTGRDGLAR